MMKNSRTQSLIFPMAKSRRESQAKVSVAHHCGNVFHLGNQNDFGETIVTDNDLIAKAGSIQL